MVAKGGSGLGDGDARGVGVGGPPGQHVNLCSCKVLQHMGGPSGEWKEGLMLLLPRGHLA